MPIRVVLDSNIWDELSVDERARNRTRQLCEAAGLEIIVPDTLHQQLLASPFGCVPAWFPTTLLTDSVCVLDYSRLGQARMGPGSAYDEHKGNSNQISDAVIVAAADTDADVFVSQDRRARERYARMRNRARSLDYETFRADLLSL
jgi:hypothetical protein